MRIFGSWGKKTPGDPGADAKEPLWLIAGLGNPGPKYERTWHNAGFMAVDILSQRTGIAVSRIKFKGIYGTGTIAGQKAILLKPATYMNNSGESISEAAAYFKVPPSRILLIYDDIDIPCGSLRIRPGGSGGTHNGMRSVISLLGTDRFPRIRVGIGPLPEHRDIAEYVLSEIPAASRESLFESVRRAAEAAEEIVSAGLESGMAKFNAKRNGKTEDEGRPDA